MATVEYWIQIENRPWDACPNGRDRMDGKAVAPAPVTKVLTSPETGVTRTHSMWKPLMEDALILRRYTANWAKPDDRKVNPWDLNEQDPTDNGTLGTIPGPVIECNVGDKVVVHLRNRDERADKDIRARIHSLHPHGFVFAPTSDGAFPLSPADTNQPVGAEAPLWASLPLKIAVGDKKKGDRVPPPILGSGQPGGTFTYTWDTFGWPTTAGTWLYHDHSVCDMDSVNRGAIGIIVIHNNDPAKHDPVDPDDVAITNGDLPGGSPNGSPISVRCFPFTNPIPRLPADLEFVGESTAEDMIMPEMAMATSKRRSKTSEDDAPALDRMVTRGNFMLELDAKLELFRRFCIRSFRNPPERAQYALLFHELMGAGMCINGRKYVGNTPTLVAGKQTKMRFCIVGMGDNFHTFHLHGHRWVIPGPDGNNPGAIQSSPQIKAVSQFEDTRTFGPANSFVFTLDESTGFMRADPFTPGSPLGEWHLHCHVLGHMSDGMMGSLLIVEGGQFFLGLPEGDACPPGGGAPPGAHVIPMVTAQANPTGFAFGTPSPLPVHAGDTVVWQDSSMAPHQIGWDTAGSPPNTGVIPAMGTSPPLVMANPGTFNYHCLIHGAGMNGSITVVP
jgi:FtsP/CotA-like multicopper oxidase with cupredoxin domain/plastocyanin